MKLISCWIKINQVTILLLFSYLITFSQPALSLKNSSYTYLKSNLEFLASDELEGREATTRGEKLAALYISEELEKYGVLPYGDSGSYFQDFKMMVTGIREESNIQFIKGDRTEAFQHGESVYYSSRSLPNNKFKNIEYDIIFAGYGVFSEDDNYNSYESIDVANKVVLVINGTPMADGEEVLNNETVKKYKNSSTAKAELAKNNGAVGLIILSDKQIMRYWDYYKRYSKVKSYKLKDEFNFEEIENNIPVMFLNEEASISLLENEILDYHSLINNNLPNPKSFLLKSKLKLNYEVDIKEKLARNVIGLIKGNNESYNSEYVTIGAHYDHEGVKNGEVYNGADDNGSGTVTILEVARRLAMKRNNSRPVLVIFHTAEEKGLKGAKFLTNNSKFIDSVIVHFNIDMVGRKSEDSIYCIGTNRISSELGELVEEVNSETSNFFLDYSFDDPNDPQRLYYRSDHVHYVNKGIPIAFFYDYMKKDYHKPTDTVDKINFTKLLKMTDLLFELTVKISNLNDGLRKDDIPLN